MKECTLGTGATCGASYLTHNFEKFLRQGLGPRAEQILTKERLAGAVRNFELTIKFTFNPWSDTCPPFFEVPLRGAPDIPEASLKDHWIKLSK